MAIYRSDQASVTFAAEAAQGGYPENSDITGAGSSANTNADANAGDKTLSFASAFTVSSGANLKVLAVIGNNTQATGPKEVRRVVGGYNTTTITLDSPLGFAHPSGSPVTRIVTSDD